MKKEYSKPQIYFDSFELSQSIAACNTDMNASDGSCAVTDDFGTYFTNSAVCEFTQPGENDRICLHVPESDPSVHSS